MYAVISVKTIQLIIFTCTRIELEIDVYSVNKHITNLSTYLCPTKKHVSNLQEKT